MSPSFNTARVSDAVNVGTGSTPVLDADVSRRTVILTNDGANIIYVALQTTDQPPTAVVNKGLRLNANGGTVTLDEFTGAIAAIALTGATNLCVVEI